jgi:hypothetical protein
MSPPHHLPPPGREANARALLIAATTGARRALRGQPREHVEEAAAAALVAVVAALAGDRLRQPLAFAATAGRNAGTDLRRHLARDAVRLAPLDALNDPPATSAPVGWSEAEMIIQLDDALRVARTEAARRPTREISAVAGALALLRAGEPLPEPDEAARKRLARGSVHLAALLAA